MKRRKFIKNNIGAVIAGPLSLNILFDEKDENANSSFKVGFAKTDISSCILDKGVFRKPLEAVCTNLHSKNNRIIIIALDLMEMPLSENLRIQKAISDIVGIPFNTFATNPAFCGPTDDHYNLRRSHLIFRYLKLQMLP